MKPDGTPTIEEVKKQVEQLTNWERVELALSIVTPKEILQNCTAEQLAEWTGMFVSPDAPEEPDEVTVKNFHSWEMIDELRSRKDEEDLLDLLDRKAIVGYVLSHFNDFDDNPELCRRLVRFVLRDELKDYIKTEKEI